MEQRAIDAEHLVLVTRSVLDGEPRRHRLWFVLDRPDLDRTTLYFAVARGDRPSWLDNLASEPQVSVEVGDAVLSGRWRSETPGDEEHDRAVRLFRRKYDTGARRPTWRSIGQIIAVDLI